MEGVSWRGESQEAAAKIIVTTRLKMEDACILTRIPWTLKKGSEKLCIFSAVFQWINWIGLMNCIQIFQCRFASINNNGHTPLSLQSYVSDVIIYNLSAGQVHVYTFTT
jgi:hypothetical protein